MLLLDTSAKFHTPAKAAELAAMMNADGDDLVYTVVTHPESKYARIEVTERDTGAHVGWF